MTLENLQILSLIFYIGAAILFLIAVIAFFSFRIPQVVSFLTGSQERKEVAALRKRDSGFRVDAELPPDGKKHGKKKGAQALLYEGSPAQNPLRPEARVKTEELPEAASEQHAPQGSASGANAVSEHHVPQGTVSGANAVSGAGAYDPSIRDSAQANAVPPSDGAQGVVFPEFPASAGGSRADLGGSIQTTLLQPAAGTDPEPASAVQPSGSVTHPLSPGMAPAAGQSGSVVVLQTEYELYFYASSIPVE